MSIFHELGIKDGKNRLHEEFLYNLGYCYVMLEKRIGEILSPFGLSPVKMNALLIIKHVGKERGLSQQELSKKMIVGPGNITRLINRLEREKLVERSSLKGDMRIKVLKVTDKASNLLKKAWPIYKKGIEKIISSIPGIDIAITTAGLSGLRETLGKVKFEESSADD